MTSALVKASRLAGFTATERGQEEVATRRIPEAVAVGLVRWSEGLTRLVLILPVLAFVTATALAQSTQGPDVAAVMAQAMTAVVTIESIEDPPPPKPTTGNKPPVNAYPQFRVVAHGSGFVVSADGWIVTNSHVVTGSRKIRVRLGDRWVPAIVKGVDLETDLALVKVDSATPLRPLPLGDSDALRVGDWVFAIGTPSGLENTLTAGIVSGKNRQTNAELDGASFTDFIQTDAAINYGNSGGPLLNVKGEVVGIPTQILIRSSNLSFAVPVNVIKNVVPQLRDRGKVSRGYLGSLMGELTFELARAFGLENSDGALVTDDTAATPAGRAGLRHGDIVLAADGVRIRSNRDLDRYVASRQPGTVVKLDVFRERRQVNLSATLEERQNQQPRALTPRKPVDLGPFGFSAVDVTPQIIAARHLDADQSGIEITDLDMLGELADQDVIPHDIIEEVNGTPIRSVREFEQAVAQVKPGDLIRLHIARFNPVKDFIDLVPHFYVVMRAP